MREAIAFRIGIPAAHLRAACVLLAAMLTVATPAALAQSRADGNGTRARVALPFACAHDPASGRLRMTPSAEQVYEIVDRREARRAIVCNSGGVCRTWVLHRFKMQCGAHRVPWMNVVASVLASVPTQALESGAVFW